MRKSSKSSFDATEKEEEKKDFRKGKKFSKGKKSSGNYRGRDASSMNDIAWYASTPQLLIDSASLPRAWATGLRHDLTHDYTGNFSNATTAGLFAGAVVLNPLSFGDDSDPVNVVARKITGYIRSFNSGAKNYDANDLMIRLLAEGEFISQLNWAIRIYATVNMYSALNRYMPEALLEMQRVDFQDVRMHLNDFRGALNNIIANASSILFVPNGFYIYKRWAWLFSNYYADSNSVKDQLYFLYPRGYHTFVINDDTSMGMLEYHEWVEDANTLLTADDIITGLRTMLEAIINDQEFAIMRGDMLKAYGNSDYTFGMIPENFTAVPAHDPVVLTQFKNIRTLPVSESDVVGGFFNIMQDANAEYLTQQTAFTSIPETWSWQGSHGDYTTQSVFGPDHHQSFGYAFCELYKSDHPADTYNPAPTAIDNMEDSRLTAMVRRTTMEDDWIFAEWTHGSEVVTDIYIGRRYFNAVTRQWGLGRELLHTFNIFLDSYSGSEFYPDNFPQYLNLTSTAMNILSDISAFDYFPPVYFITGQVIEGDDANVINFNLSGNMISNPVMRVANLAFFTTEMVDKMNNCALKSEFNITGFSNPKDSKIASK